MGCARTNRGLALIVVVGMLVLLSISAIAMGSLAVQARIRAGLGTDRAAARLLAGSGIEYALARLLGNAAVPSAPDVDNQPDDWTFRDESSAPLEQARNPSYARTEPYRDAGGDGRYDAGADTFTDLNGNARFDAFSGRLRNRYGPWGGTFALRIERQSNRINVNDGYLDAQNRNDNVDAAGQPIPDFRDLGLRWGEIEAAVQPALVPSANDPPLGEAVKDTLYPEGVVPRNRRLADLMNELGLVLNVNAAAQAVPSPPQVGPYRASDPIRQVIADVVIAGIQSSPVVAPGMASDLGDRIIQGRPLGGYQSLSELQKTVGADWDRVRPYLTLSSPYRLPFWGSSYEHSPMLITDGSAFGKRTYAGPEIPAFLAWRSPIDLETAPVPLLQALAEGITLGRNNSGQGDGTSTGATKSRRIVQPAEASALAEGIAAARPFGSWYRFVQWLNANRSRVFTGSAEEIAWKVNAVEVHWNPHELDNLTAETVYVPPFTQLNSFPFLPPYSWYSYDQDRGAVRTNGDTRFTRFTRNREQRLVRNRPPSTFSSLGEMVGAWGTYPVELSPLESDFRIESAGKAGRFASSSLSTAGATTRRITAFSQAAFENLGAPRSGEEVELVGRPDKDRTQTWPFFPLDSCPDYDGKPEAFLLPTMGTIRLMDASDGPVRGTEVFYLPCWEQGQPLRDPVVVSVTRENFEDFSSLRAVPTDFPVPPFTGALNGGRVFNGYSSAAGAMLPLDDLYGLAVMTPAFPGSSQGTLFQWGPGLGLPNAGDFPLVQGGRVPFGTAEWVGLNYFSALQLDNPMQWKAGFTGVVGADPSAVQAIWSTQHTWATSPIQVPQYETLESIRVLTIPDPHRIAFVFGPDGVQGYIGGTPDPGLSSREFAQEALDAARPQNFTAGYVDEARLFREEQPPAAIRARATWPRHWAPIPGALIDGRIPAGASPGLRERLRSIPSFTSALHRLPRPVRICGCDWEGFVPKRIEEAIDATPGSGPPLSIELLCYGAADGTGTERRAPLDPNLWRLGGGSTPLDVRGVRSFRFRVRMDASALQEFNNDTPVLDSIDIRYGTAGRMASWNER